MTDHLVFSTIFLQVCIFSSQLFVIFLKSGAMLYVLWHPKQLMLMNSTYVDT